MAASDDEPFPVLDVSDWPVTALEPGGTDEKVWLGVPDTTTRALFKPNRSHAGSEQGEDWPEKLASELATALGVPAAPIDLAERAGRRGCLSYDIVPMHWELQPGAVLLNQLLDFQHDPWDKAACGHTLSNIRQVLRGYRPPPGFSGPPEFDAFSVFAGYLLLDGLISNRDRHSENWAVLRGPDMHDQCLAPSFDHASALGFNLSDERRATSDERRATSTTLPRPQHDGCVPAARHRIQVRGVSEGHAGRARAHRAAPGRRYRP